MIINNENKNQVMQGMMKRGFNQKPSDIVDRLNRVNQTNNIVKPVKQENKGNKGTYQNPQDYHGLVSKMNELSRRIK